MTPTVDGIARAAVAATEALLREAGAVQPPTAHLLAEDMDQPYVGYLTCRPFGRGPDAEAAISEMGALPAALAATRIVLTWEHADLRAAFGMSGAHPNALVLVDADLTGEHDLWWHPFVLDVGPCAAAERACALPEWGQPERRSDVRLPTPVARLLDVWRALRETDLEETVGRLEAAGHRMRWAQRT